MMDEKNLFCLFLFPYEKTSCFSKGIILIKDNTNRLVKNKKFFSKRIIK